MKFIYLTSKKYPANTADHHFVKSMAEAFAKILGDDFRFFVRADAADELKDANATLIKAPQHFRSVFYFFWLPKYVWKNNLNEKNTIFFSNDPYLLATLIFWKKLFGLKYIICSDWHQLFLDWRDKYVSRGSDFLICTSEKLKGLIPGLSGIEKDKILVAYGGVDLESFNISPEKIIGSRKSFGSENDIFIGYVGFYKTMGMAKGLDTMLKSLPLLPQNFKMVFVGGRGDEIDEYKAMAENLGVSNRAVFIPAVPIHDVPAYEKALDILVIPYPDEPHFRDFGFPMKVYEYVASGRPIIYSDLPIIAEVLSDCAVPFEPGDAKDLAEKIAGLIGNRPSLRNLTDKAYEKVKDFTWQKRAEKIINFVGSNQS
jgi:glycosyltransferase involved in cell wall biosynthesis